MQKSARRVLKFLISSFAFLSFSIAQIIPVAWTDSIPLEQEIQGQIPTKSASGSFSSETGANQSESGNANFFAGSSALFSASSDVISPQEGVIFPMSYSPIPGDADRNGVVDDNDYLIWRSEFGNTSPKLINADFNGNGTVDAADYVLWRDHKGQKANIPISFLDVTSQNALSTLVNPWIVDLNGDGRVDAVDASQLLMNLGNGTFQHGTTTGAPYTHKNFADLNHDGWVDLLVTTEVYGQRSYIFRYNNNQSNSFPSSSYSQLPGSALFGPWLADFDQDGYLDMMSGDWSFWVDTRDQAYFIFDNSQSGGDPYSLTRLYPTLPQYNTWNVSLQSAVIRDFDGDGDQDVYYTVYIVEGGEYRRVYRHYIFRNDGNRQFTRTDSIGIFADPPFFTIPTSFNSATETADFNNDGKWDVIIDNHVYFGNGNLTFTQGPAVDIPGYVSPNHPTKSRFGDINNDGFIDILTYHQSEYYTNDIILTTYLGDGTGNFMRAGSSTFAIPQNAQSDLVTLADFNGDGALDIYAFGKVLLNQNTTNHALRLKLVGTDSNRDAIGAKVTIRIGNKTQMCAIDGNLETERIAHFGLGNAQTVDELTIKWPNGLVETYHNVPASAGVIIKTEGQAQASSSSADSAVLNSDQTSGNPIVQAASATPVSLIDRLGPRFMYLRHLKDKERWIRFSPWVQRDHQTLKKSCADNSDETCLNSAG